MKTGRWSWSSFLGVVLMATPAHLAAQQQVYQYDDGEFESGLFSTAHETQSAQRFRLAEGGEIQWLEACFWRRVTDNESRHRVTFNIHEDAGGVPGTRLLGNGEVVNGNVAASTSGQTENTCIRTTVSQRVNSGDVWVSVIWYGRQGIVAANLGGEEKLISLDWNGTGDTEVLGRDIDSNGNPTDNWARPGGTVGALGIRMAIVHGSEPTTPDPDPEPDPDPDPDPDPEPPAPDPEPDPDPPGPGDYTDCVPRTTPLVFAGGYRVSMCYQTPSGEIGEGKAGIWASGESGLLWFFNRDNAEVLIKVLDGCAISGHRWVFVAPVTDLAFNLYVTDSNGQRWPLRNPQGRTAPTRSDTSAFRCE